MNVGTLRYQAYEQIRGQLVSGELGPGSMISEPALAKRLSIGRTPVREAIQQLQVEGLVERVPRRGTIVRTPQRHDIVELYELREGLESFAVMLATKRITPADVAKLNMLCEQIRLIANQMQQTGIKLLDGSIMRRFLAADMGFHMLLIGAAGNRRIIKIVSDSHVMARIFGAPRQEHSLQVVKETYGLHRDILQAVKDSDGEAARRFMAEHIRTSLRETLEYYDRMQAKADQGEPIPLCLPEGLLEELDRIEKEFGLGDSP